MKKKLLFLFITIANIAIRFGQGQIIRPQEKIKSAKKLNVADTLKRNSVIYEVLDIKNKTLSVKSGKDTYGDITIPEVININGYKFKVVEISAGAFEGNQNLKNINLPNTIHTIGERAFKNSGLESIHIPDEVHMIKKETFANCKNLSHFNLTQVNYIGEYAFTQCKAQMLFLNDNIKNLGYGAFSNCSYLESVILSPSLFGSRNDYFFNCPNLKSISPLNK